MPRPPALPQSTNDATRVYARRLVLRRDAAALARRRRQRLLQLGHGFFGSTLALPDGLQGVARLLLLALHRQLGLLACERGVVLPLLDLGLATLQQPDQLRRAHAQLVRVGHLGV